MYKLLLAIIVIAFATLLAGCGGESAPTEVEVTRIVEVEKTVEVPVEVEVTRIIEVPVEVIHEVVVDKIVEVEVTRIVEVAVPVEITPVARGQTASSRATATLQPQNEAASSSPTPVNIKADLLTSMILARTQIQGFGGLSDNAAATGIISCQSVVDQYAAIAASPTYDVSSSDPVVQNAYTAYRNALDIFAEGAKDIYLNCNSAVTNNSGTTIPFQQWGVARQKVNAAVDVIHPAIQSLGGS